MLQVNGAANAAAIAAAKAAGVPRFAYISAHIPPVPGFEYLMQGYVQGKRQAEEELARQYPEGESVVVGVRLGCSVFFRPGCAGWVCCGTGLVGWQLVSSRSPLHQLQPFHGSTPTPNPSQPPPPPPPQK